MFGLAQASRKLGYHDDPLQGTRQGQRSIRLNRQWRAIYIEIKEDILTLIRIEEVTPHDY